MEYKQHESSRYPLSPINGDYWIHTIQRVKEMATAKLAFIIADLLGIPVSLYALFFVDLDVFQKAVIWLLVVGYLGARLYFYIVFSNQKKRKNELDLIEQENGIIKTIDVEK